MNALKPKIQGDKYQYRLDNNDYPTWIPLYKNIGLDPSSFTFRTTITMNGNNDRSGIVFCFGGNENIPFRSNSGSNLNRLMLSISPGKCTLLREQKSGILVLGEAAIPAPILTEGVDIQLTASRQGGNKQVYELLIGDLPPRLITDPSPPEQPLQGDAFGLQMEGHVSLTISKLTLSSITLSAKSVAKNGNAETDLVLTKEEDAIPGSVSGYDSKTGTLTLSTDKDYPGIPRDLPSRPSTWIPSFCGTEQERRLPPPSPPQPPDEGRFPPARRYSEHGFPEYHPAASATRTDFPAAEKHHPRGIPESRPAIPFHSLIDPAMKQAMTLSCAPAPCRPPSFCPMLVRKGSLRLNPGKNCRAAWIR